MPLQTTRYRGTVGALVATACFTVVWMMLTAALSVPASAAIAPHVPTETDTDVCAMCHRTHSSASSATWTDSNDNTHTALLTGSAATDAGMCYSCHGIEQLGSGTDIQSSFEASSAHSLDPSISLFGTAAAKQCSTCHDSHGSARTASDTPYPALLRSEASNGTTVYSGNGVCYTCHLIRAASVFPGEAVFEGSPHASIEAPVSGTNVVCSACHDPHGSAVAPMIRSTLATPSAPGTATVVANDASLCIGCHPTALGVWGGTGSYTGSAHQSSAATISVAGEYASMDDSRTVGTCQSCHAVHGASDASGTIIPNLLAAKGRALCDSCHRSGGVASTNFASLAFSPTTPGNEVVGVWASAAADRFGTTQVFARETTAAGTPVGPRDISSVTTVGATTVGDLDGDGASEVVVSDLADNRVALVRRDVLRSAAYSMVALPGAQPAKLLSIGDVFVDGTGLPELIAVSETGALEVSRLSAGSFVSQGTASVPGTPTAVASGDVTGSAGADIAVTTQADELYLITDDGAGALDVRGPFATGASPIAVRIAHIDNDATKRDIAVLNSAETTLVVSLFTGDGNEYLSGGGPLPAGSTPHALAVGDIFTGNTTPPGTSGAEFAVAYSDGAGTDGLRVIEPDLTSATDYAFADNTNPGALSLGDADGDGDNDVAVALRGDFSRDASAVAPSIVVMTPDAGATGLDPQFTLPVGGTQLASERAYVAITDMGAVAPSRHPVGAVPGAHESTETVASPRHVECDDCHNPHEARGDAADTAMQEGELLGAWGVTRDSLNATPERQAIITREYEVCYSCHSGAQVDTPVDVAARVATSNASFHPIEGASPDTSATGSTLTPAVSSGDTIKCTACHGTSYAAPTGPHRSGIVPLLKQRVSGARADDATMLCYTCHRTQIYLTGTDDGVGPNRSGFYDTTLGAAHPQLHSYHASNGVTCAACHDSHGSVSRRAMLTGAGYTFTETSGGGECASGCHTGGTTHSYTR